MSVCHHSLVVGNLHVHSGTNEVFAIVVPYENCILINLLACHCVPAMDVCSIVLLVGELTVNHAQIAAAVDEVSSIGCCTDDAVAAGSGNNLHFVKLNVFHTLNDEAHTSAVVKINILHKHCVTLVECKAGIRATSRTEGHDITHCTCKVFEEDFEVAVGKSLGLQSAPQPIVVNVVCYLFLLAVKLEKATIGIGDILFVADAQKTALNIYIVSCGEFEFQPAIAHCHNLALRVECVGKVDVEVANGDVVRILEVEGRNEACEEKCSSVTLDCKTIGILYIDGDAFLALSIVADVLILLEAVFIFDEECVAGEHQCAVLVFETLLESETDAGVSVALHILGNIIFYIHGFCLGSRRTGCNKCHCRESKKLEHLFHVTLCLILNL